MHKSAILIKTIAIIVAIVTMTIPEKAKADWCRSVSIMLDKDGNEKSRTEGPWEPCFNGTIPTHFNKDVEVSRGPNYKGGDKSPPDKNKPTITTANAKKTVPTRETNNMFDIIGLSKETLAALKSLPSDLTIMKSPSSAVEQGVVHPGSVSNMCEIHILYQLNPDFSNWGKKFGKDRYDFLHVNFGFLPDSLQSSKFKLANVGIGPANFRRYEDRTETSIFPLILIYFPEIDEPNHHKNLEDMDQGIYKTRVEEIRSIGQTYAPTCEPPKS